MTKTAHTSEHDFIEADDEIGNAPVADQMT